MRGSGVLVEHRPSRAACPGLVARAAARDVWVRRAAPPGPLARSARALSSTVGGFVRWAAAIAGYERFLKHVLPALR